jgi:DNA-binding XRE family transcriptional regulator
MAAVNLAELRFNEGLSPEELGDLCGVAGKTIRRLEDGQRPTPQIAKKLADHFGVKASDIWPLDQGRASVA